MTSDLVIIIPLVDTNYCPNCDTVFYVEGGNACPSCESPHYVPLTTWIKPLREKEDVEDPLA